MILTIVTNAVPRTKPVRRARRFWVSIRKLSVANRHAPGAFPPGRTRAAVVLQIVVRAGTQRACCHDPAVAAARVPGPCNLPADFGCSPVAENGFASENQPGVVRVTVSLDPAAGFDCCSGAKTG